VLEVVTGSLLEALPIAHTTEVGHEHASRGGGVNGLLIAVGVLITGAAVGALVWLKGRMRTLEEREESEERASVGSGAPAEAPGPRPG
jgi:hypothetical protein